MTANSIKIDLSNIEDLLKLLLEISAWAEDLQNNMDRLKEDLDEFVASSGSSGDDSSRGNSKDDSCEESSEDSSKKDQDSDESDEDDSRCQVTVPNKDPDGSLNGSASFRRHHPHSNDLTIMLDLLNPESSGVYDGTNLEKITDKTIDLEDEVPLYRKKIVYSIIDKKLVDMSDAWDMACLAREKRIREENKRYKNLIKTKMNKSFDARSYQEVFA